MNRSQTLATAAVAIVAVGVAAICLSAKPVEPKPLPKDNIVREVYDRIGPADRNYLEFRLAEARAEYLPNADKIAIESLESSSRSQK